MAVQVGIEEELFWSLTPGQLQQQQRGFWWRFEQFRDLSAWSVNWILRGLLGSDAPTLSQMVGKDKPSKPDGYDAGMELLKIVDPERYREYRWAEEHGTTLD